MSIGLRSVEFSAAQFDQIRQILYRTCGIDLKAGKENLVEARLTKRLRHLGLDDFDAYIRRVEEDGTGGELAFMVDALTTNKTSFFREDQHFDFLRQQVLPELGRRSRKVRIWCAGCSSGEEPFTLAILLREAWPDVDRMDVRILATDISDTVLGEARQSVYSQEKLEEVPPPLRHKYFARAASGGPDSFQVVPEVRKLVHFAALNLIGPWPMSGPFDVIFCRNVMIYFDRQTQGTLVNHFFDLLAPGGHFFISHSESLTGIPSEFNYVQPAVYVR